MITPKTANFLNAIVLIITGLYGYFFILTDAGTHAPTALIPAVFGSILAVLGFVWNKNEKLIAHLSVTLALVLLVICANKFFKIEDWGAKKYLFLACILSNAFALFIFVKSFIAARSKK